MLNSDVGSECKELNNYKDLVDIFFNGSSNLMDSALTQRFSILQNGEDRSNNNL